MWIEFRTKNNRVIRIDHKQIFMVDVEGGYEVVLIKDTSLVWEVDNNQGSDILGVIDDAEQNYSETQNYIQDFVNKKLDE